MASLTRKHRSQPDGLRDGSRWHSWRGLAGFALALLIAGCATGPQYPLYSPLAVTGTFGYSEQAISSSSYRVTYISPRRTSFSPYARSEPQRTYMLNLTNDMAMIRAAELAEAQGHETFRVTQRDNDSDVDRQYYHGWCNDPFWPRRPYYYSHSYRCGPDGYTYFQSRSTLTVEFGHKPGENHFVAKDVLMQLQQTYPTARAIGSAKL
jgi:hypothetical protein